MYSSLYSLLAKGATNSSVFKERYIYLCHLDLDYCSSVVQENYAYLKEKLSEVCGRHGERVLETRHNPISLGRLYIRGWIELEIR